MRIKTAILLWSINYSSVQGAAFPNICTVVDSPYFLQNLEMTYHIIPCGGPIPRPCVEFSYYVPKYFIEVVSNAKETFFGALPGVRAQLTLTPPSLPFGAEDDSESYSFHAHTLNIPFGQVFDGLACGNALPDMFCFSAMSEHLGSNWKTGAADLWQPEFLAWSIAPKACLIKGAAMSAFGNTSMGGGGDSSMCSFNMSWLPKFPPSNQPICTGWGIHFPRTGTVTSSDQLTASLVVASRIRSIGAEVLKGISISPDEKWQMILPQASASFREGQNIALLQIRGVNELGRFRGTFKNYLYAIWQRTGCVRELPWLASTKVWLSTLQSVCKGWK